jgi:SAM-dependent methyltransferase
MQPWDEQEAQAYGDLGEQAHVPVLAEALASLIDRPGQRMLDFGCGGGRLSLALARRCGAGQVLGLDVSAELIGAARQLAGTDEHVRFEVGDERRLPVKPPADTVVCSLMLMMCRDRPQLHAVVRGLAGSLDADGRLLIALTHPCFRRADFGEFRNELPADFDYWDSGRAYDVVLDPDEAEASATISDTHWTLSDYLNALAEADLAVDRSRELPLRTDGRRTG